MIKDKQRKFSFRRQTALLLTGALLAGLLPLGTVTKSRAAEQPALRNPRILKTTQEVAPGSAGKKELKKPTTENGITTWDCIWFGNYWQEDTNGDGKADKKDDKTPIKWRVLSVEGDDVFLLADKNLDCQKYNDTDTSVTWENCTMRSWLNGYGAEANKDGRDYSDNNFLDQAFLSEEQTAVKTTNVVNHDNPGFGTEGGKDTSDKVYLLSIDEVTDPVYGFNSSDDSDSTRQAVNTAYVAGGGEINSGNMRSAGSVDDWWLRSPGDTSRYASSVDIGGDVDTYGVSVSDHYYAARPALHLNLSSASSWSYAGTVTSDDVAEWDCIWFGNYWQEDTNGDGKADKNDAKQPIKWRVLSVNGDDAFLLADKNLDCQKYNDTDTSVTWENCTMRSWLNGYGGEINKDGKDFSDSNFLNNAFSAAEQSAIKTTNVVNDDNSDYGTDGGNNTSDKVYLLSIDEVTNPAYGFNSSRSNLAESRRALNTAFAKGQGAWTSTSEEYAENGYWWLRSPGYFSDDASYVNYGGDVDSDGNFVYDIYYAARPALHLNLSSLSSWSYAGTVTSEGGETPLPSEPGNTQKPQETSAPGTPSVALSAPQPGTPVISAPGIPSASVKSKVGKVSSLKLKQKKRTVTASWKKLTGAKGYQICYSTSKKWKGKKQKLVSKNKVVIKNLKKKKNYYFRVRAYRLEGTKKVYGAWSNTKKIKIKK